MRRKALIRLLLMGGCVLLREGAKHSIYKNLFTGAQTSVPRHAFLLKNTAQIICKQLGVLWRPK